MIIMMTSTYPLNKGTEVRDIFLKVATPPPPYMKSLGNYMVASGSGKDYKNYNIVEIDDEHIVEGLNELTRRTIPLFSIEGYGTTMEILTTVRAAIELEREVTGQ